MLDKLPLILYLLALTGATAYFIYAVVRFRRDLNKPSPEVRYSIPPYVAISIGLFFILITLPFYYKEWGNIPRVFFENPVTISFIVFTLVGVGLILYALRKTIRHMRVSREVVIEEEELTPGDVLSGFVRLKGLEAVREPLKISLVLQQAYVVSHREKRIGEKPVWSQSAETYPVIFKNSTEIPFKFDLRDDFPPEDSWEGGYELALVVEGNEFGVETFFLKRKGEPINYIPENSFNTGSVQSVGEIIAEREYANPWYNLATTFFVVLFALFMWFMLRSGDILKDPFSAIAGLIASGFVLLMIFFLPVYILALKLRSKSAEERKKGAKGVLSMAVLLIITFGGVWGYAIYRHLQGDSEPLEMIFDLVLSRLVDGILGMLVLLGLFGVVASIRGVLHRSP